MFQYILIPVLSLVIVTKPESSIQKALKYIDEAVRLEKRKHHRHKSALFIKIDLSIHPSRFDSHPKQ